MLSSTTPVPLPDSNFNESSYLSLHKDVMLAVQRGYFKSGREHYEKHGKAEGRKVCRFDSESHSIKDYSRLVSHLIATHPDNIDLAMAKAVGALTLGIYRDLGDRQYQVLRRFGLQEGHAIYDLACGSGRTASALQRHGWTGAYAGADIIPELVEYATQKNPEFRFFVHPDYSIRADDNSQDMIFAWSLFTHLQLEEIFLYSKDCLRALKPGGIFIFSFLTFKDQLHREHFLSRVKALENGIPSVHLDTFLNQEMIGILFTQLLGFRLVKFVDDETASPSDKFGQALAIFQK